MTDHADFDIDLSRRKLLAAAGVTSTVMMATTMTAIGASTAEAQTVAAPAVSAPAVTGLHLQFGGDAASQVTVSWHTLSPVANPRVILGRPDGRLEKTVKAETRSYVDGKSKQTVYAHHAKLVGLSADTAFMYGAMHDGAAPEFGTFRTAPKGRAAFTFTSFADQATPTVGKRYVPPEGVTLPFPIFVNDNLGAPAAGDTTMGVEKLRPLFHLFQGDLCYANLSEDRVRTWVDFWENNTRSARNRPWMPSPANHEIERGNGPIGYSGYQTYFSLPETEGQTELTRGLWYAFTVGSVRVISLNNDDVCYQDGGDIYIRGYSKGAQKAWLEKELAAARSNKAIDWVVVAMHQPAMSNADKFNGADLGVRQEFLPLFDKYGVDLVVTGHEHHYERSHPIKGAEANETLTPKPADTRLDVIDTTKGAVHMIIGGGGTSAPSNELFFNPPGCRVIVSVNPPNEKGKRTPNYVHEDAPWLAVRNAAHAYGFASFSVDPGKTPGGLTTMKVTYYDVTGPGGQMEVFETFTLQRPRSDKA